MVDATGQDTNGRGSPPSYPRSTEKFIFSQPPPEVFYTFCNLSRRVRMIGRWALKIQLGVLSVNVITDIVVSKYIPDRQTVYVEEHGPEN